MHNRELSIMAPRGRSRSVCSRSGNDTDITPAARQQQAYASDDVAGLYHRQDVGETQESNSSTSLSCWTSTSQSNRSWKALARSRCMASRRLVAPL
jgi:hypothetical protein